MPDLRDPTELTASTLSHYEAGAVGFRDGTRGHDVSQNILAFLRAIEGESSFSILDLGCGPGRDLCAFRTLGHEAIGLDGAESFVRMARAESGCEVWHQDFIALDLPARRFDGVFANASLFHAPRDCLPAVLGALHAALKPRGVLFCSNPRGENQEGFNGSRYGCYYDYPTWHGLVTDAGFDEVEHYYRPSGRPREEQPWLATVWRRRDV